MGGLDVLSLMLGKEIEKQSGGGGGTTNYGDLENKPQINGVTLNGDKSLEDLGIPSDLADLSDIGIENPTDGQIMKYNETTGKWENYDGPSGCIKLGKVEAFFSESAPAGYLICDGTVYNKSDYPLLAAHLLSLTTHSQYEVDGDNTKFKVPDLRGEFLRGTGTNGHIGEGAGSNVGVHQDATRFKNIGMHTSAGLIYGTPDTQFDWMPGNPDSQNPTQNQLKKVSISNEGSYTGSINYTARPTNTSVLFCIAYCDIYVEDRHTYSTNEHIVGTWIDGRPVYEKTTQTSIPSGTSGVYDAVFDSDLTHQTINAEGFILYASGFREILPFVNADGSTYVVNTQARFCYNAVERGSSIQLKCRNTVSEQLNIMVTYKYTKTTDSVNP